MLPRFLSLTVLLASLPFLGGCGNNGLKFNNELAKITRDLNEAGHEFIEVRKASDPVKTKAALDTLTQKFDRIKADADKVVVPSSKDAQEFHNVFTTFLKNREKMIKEDYKELIQLESADVPDLNRRNVLIREIQTQEAADIAALNAAQARFAKLSGFKIK